MSEPSEAQQLATIARELQDEVTTLRGDVTVLVRRSRRLRRMVIVTVVSLVFDLALSVALGVVVGNLATQGDQIQAQQSQTTRTRHDVLCPLYQVFVTFDDPAQRAQLPAAKRASYDHAFSVIRQGYDALDCSAP